MTNMVTPQEAKELANYICIDTSHLAEDIYRSVYETFATHDDDTRFNQFWALGAVFEAGRVQGIREERAKKASRSAVILHE